MRKRGEETDLERCEEIEQEKDVKRLSKRERWEKTCKREREKDLQEREMGKD